ncbi:SH3 domain-containing protein [Schizophyllum fasciatum]
MTALADPLLAHIVSRVEADVDFLISHNYLAPADAAHFLQRLTHLHAPQAAAFPVPTPASTYSAPAAPPPSAPVAPSTQQARAKWAYNEDGSDPDDLSFAEGDVIEVVEETNADWWTGRARGRQGLFPSTYVERIAAPAPAKEKAIYKPFGAGAYGQPPSNAPAPSYAPAPSHAPSQPATNAVGLQQDAAGQEKKKGKFGKYGNTMAHSAAGGVGFGAGEWPWVAGSVR